jgi:hypothetical protein
MFFFIACTNSDPFPAAADTGLPDKYTAGQLPDVESALPEQDVQTDTETPIIPDEGAPIDEEEVLPDTMVPDADIGGNCKIDADCAPNICVKAKCALGCASDDDCKNYANTTCNTKLGRCLNTVASSGACDETNCPAGCCYAEKGFTDLKCTSTATVNICGICPQGEIYMGSSQCIPTACKVGETKCQTYNSSNPRYTCFECKATDFVCADNTTCTPGSALMMLNVMECVPAGERCSTKDICCSGMPCIQGYCY